MPWELPDLMEPERLSAGLEKLNIVSHIDRYLPEVFNSGHAVNTAQYAAISALESRLYLANQLLRDTDWASMAHSVEVRTPLVDFQLLRDAAPLLIRQGDRHSKRCLANAPSKPLPNEVTNRKKTGFGTPLGGWLKEGGSLDQWRRLPFLADERCHWSRRLAYAICQTGKQA